MLWQILHPIPPCTSFSTLPPNPWVCNLVYRESQLKGMVPYRVLTNHLFLHTQGGRVGERVVEGEEGRVLQGRKPLPNDLDGHLLCQGCPILPVILVKGIFNGHHWKQIKEGNLFYLLQSYLSKTDALGDQPLPSTVHLKNGIFWTELTAFSYNPCKNAWDILHYLFSNENSNSLYIDLLSVN